MELGEYVDPPTEPNVLEAIAPLKRHGMFTEFALEILRFLFDLTPKLGRRKFKEAQKRQHSHIARAFLRDQQTTKYTYFDPKNNTQLVTFKIQLFVNDEIPRIFGRAF